MTLPTSESAPAGAPPANPSLPQPQPGGDSAQTPPQVSAPTITLPKGGGAIRGIGEKFGVNPVTGTGSMSVPIATSPGRSGFGPQLSLSYDSGSGNGPFGFGWSLSIPSITRKTDKGLPRYADADDSDVFLLSGAEDLVPELAYDASGQLVLNNGQPVTVETQRTISIDGATETYLVRRYRPRIEGLFARIERWTRTDGDVHWRSITPDNVLTLYGADAGSRITDPADARRVFSWLISETRDDKGNAVVYEYRPDDGLGVDMARPDERHRGGPDDPRRRVNRFPKRVRYGNPQPLLDATGVRPHRLSAQDIAGAGWMFEVVFDYGDHDPAAPGPDDDRIVDATGTPRYPWPLRPDPFSRYRARFEVRTTRLCRRILMFHHFPDVPDVGADCLVSSTDLTHTQPTDPGAPIYSMLTMATHSAYRRGADGSYLSKSLPPVEFSYTEPIVQNTVHTIDPDSLASLPEGVDGSTYRWVDLYGEGLSGVLTEQAGGWFYKPNLSPLDDDATGTAGTARLGPLQTVGAKPAPTLAAGAQFMDLSGDGQPHLVQFDGPTPGSYEYDPSGGWQPFRPFTSRPNLDFGDPNLRFLDLDGDGLTDILLTEQDALIWHESLGDNGFGPARRTVQAVDEERGPHLVFAEAVQTIFLADLSGDGLTDLVRIRNGEICYWPNLGYGQFGAKITMDNAPWFDNLTEFDPKRVRLADIDGSGTTDIVYLHRGGPRLYFNQSGNSWSTPHTVAGFPRLDDMATAAVVDLLGNGTACLVWSSPLPGDAGRQMRYIDLMGGQKPNLLTRTDNNLGAETVVTYAPSTKFYLQDQRAGTPWVTRLPFPVHVVEQSESVDWVGRNRFTSRYAYHHGYFDGEEREFRGFGMVEQWDTELLAALTTDGAFPVGENIDTATYVPPVHTKTWFHTGVYIGGGHVSDVYAGEYFREPGLTDADAQALLLPDTVLPTGLSADEEREACRALKGAMLRQEVYADDAGPAASPAQIARAATPYTVTEQNYAVRTLQPRGLNPYCVFYRHVNEALNFHYERDPADPRLQHTLTLEVDAYGNVLKEAAIGYGRRTTIRITDNQGQTQQAPNPGLAALTLTDQAKQTITLLTYTEHHLTNSIEADDAYRTPQAADAATYELTGYTPTGTAGRFRAADLVESDPNAVGQLRQRFSTEIPYEATPTGGECRRPIERQRILYRRDDLTGLLPLGQLESLALAGENYRLAFTPGLLTQIFQRPRSGQSPEPLLPDPVSVLGGQGADQGGYVLSQDLKGDNRFPADDPDNHWWIPSGRTYFSAGASDDATTELGQAQAHFFLGRRYRDAFGYDTTITFDANDLLAIERYDALNNQVTVDVNDYRVLQPRLISDPNGNQTEVGFDTLGLVVGTAVMGKPQPAPAEGDSLTGFITDPPQSQIDDFFTAPDPHTVAPGLLHDATTRVIYDVDRFRRSRQAHPDDHTLWQPACAATLTRETHATATLPPQGLKIQIGFAYSDGFGRVIQQKVQAEPGPVIGGGSSVDPRWVCSGWTIFNNKGKPVRQYEPFFTASTGFEFGVQVGVSLVVFYDPADRVIATLHPNNTYDKVVFDPWQTITYDVNDTCATRNDQTGDPRTDTDISGYVANYFADLAANTATPWQTWYSQRAGGTLGPDEQTAATRAAAHADTPTIAHADALGRPFLTVARNRVVCPGHDLDGTEDQFNTRVDLDIEGNQRAVRDAVVQAGDQQGRIVMRYDYNMLATRIHHLSMEAGARWTLNDVTGKPIRSWDSRAHTITTAYDALRRPTGQTIRGSTADSDPRTLGRDTLIATTEYGEPAPNAAPADQDRAQQLNLRTRIYRHRDTAGIVTNARVDASDASLEAYDFKGNPLHSTRQLVSDYTAIPDWSNTPALDDETFEASTLYDALNRPIQSIAPHSSLPGTKLNIVQPVFNEANLLARVDVWLDHGNEPTGALDPANDAPSPVGVAGLEHNAKGQRLRIDYKNGAATTYAYDPLTFRLTQLVTTRNPATFPGDDPHPATTGWPGRLLQNLSYAYDPAGNITHIADDAQQTIFFNNQRIEPSNDYVYDAIYRLIQAGGREHVGSNGVLIPYSYNDAGRVGLTPQPGDGNAMGIYTERYVYDAVGNFLQMQHRGSASLQAGWTRAYTYVEPSLIEDGNAGALLKTSNRLTRTTLNPNGNNPITEPYSYDPHGNMTSFPHLSAVRWNFADQLQTTSRQVVTNGGTPETTYYVYDSNGQRVRKVTERFAPDVQTPARKDERICLGGFEVYRTYENDGTTTLLERETLHVMDDKQRIALVETRTLDTDGNDQAPQQLIRYQLGNHLGSVSLELDDRAQIISYEEYAPFGSTTYQAVRSQTETPKRYRYTGMERDGENGFGYHGARYYAPWLGRWTTSDPSGLIDGTNLFRYGRDNPLKWLDPGGTDSHPPERSRSKPEAVPNAIARGLWRQVEAVLGAVDAALRPLGTDVALRDLYKGLITSNSSKAVNAIKALNIDAAGADAAAQIAKGASDYRNNVRVATRTKMSPLGKVTSEGIGKRSDWSDIIKKGDPFDTALSPEQRIAIAETIATKSGAPRSTAGFIWFQRGVKTLPVIGAFFNGLEMGSGINEIERGEVAPGIIDISEGGGNLALSIGTIHGVRTGAIGIAEGTGAATCFTTLVAGASLMFGFEESRRSARGETLLADSANEDWTKWQREELQRRDTEGRSAGGAARYVASEFGKDITGGLIAARHGTTIAIGATVDAAVWVGGKANSIASAVSNWLP
ncbi:SpvB/TcaC N-terminal domain-containing protein [Mycobacterium sp. OTB74]|uniref:SpvB/TcaC N-terminal domain-containing protein n=1 Tax=Mycobacterium sp. OTB74 TaxID=1853452 RepID=UPI00247684B7|nr:SpvB/TcaC N-terminal domain-containing protein [Mycobacterium sp. OTB74]MDH6245483.1 RHS repeat-associated protein [Mycobacterium sp. OTB74]